MAFDFSKHKGLLQLFLPLHSVFKILSFSLIISVSHEQTLFHLALFYFWQSKSTLFSSTVHFSSFSLSDSPLFTNVLKLICLHVKNSANLVPSSSYLFHGNSHYISEFLSLQKTVGYSFNFLSKVLALSQHYLTYS
uniref:Uncharacterized protein n=1 Tax=Micrurus paraensis TaxID=1970185 RepID=A0A2D4KI18_9SAUR